MINIDVTHVVTLTLKMTLTSHKGHILTQKVDDTGVTQWVHSHPGVVVTDATHGV